MIFDKPILCMILYKQVKISISAQIKAILMWNWSPASYPLHLVKINKQESLSLHPKTFQDSHLIAESVPFLLRLPGCYRGRMEREQLRWHHYMQKKWKACHISVKRSMSWGIYRWCQSITSIECDVMWCDVMMPNKLTSATTFREDYVLAWWFSFCIYLIEYISW